MVDNNRKNRVCEMCREAPSVVGITVGFDDNNVADRKMMCPGCAADQSLKIARMVRDVFNALKGKGIV